MSNMVRRINAEVAALAPVLNSETQPDAVTVGETTSPVRLMAKRHGGAVYAFAIEDRGGATPATFAVPGVGAGTVTVIGEERTIPMVDGAFTDTFDPYGIHLYRVDPA